MMKSQPCLKFMTLQCNNKNANGPFVSPKISLPLLKLPNKLLLVPTQEQVIILFSSIRAGVFYWAPFYT